MLLERVQEAVIKRSKAYPPELIESLRNSREAEEYLNAALEDEGPELFLLALRNVVEADTKCFRYAEIRSSKASMSCCIVLGFRLAGTASR